MGPISKFAAAALIIAAPALAADRFEKTIHASVSYQGGRVTIEHGFGRVEVHTTGADEVTARGTVRSSDADLGNQVRFAVSNGTNGVTIRTVYPDIHTHGENVSYSADIEVTVPERAPLHLRNRFGSIEVEGLRAPADIVNSQGQITIRNIAGGRIENSFGSITVEGSAGDTTVQNANGSIDVSDVRGQVTINNRFGAIHLRRADKGASIDNSNGSISVSDVKGPTSISDGFASIEARNIGGPTSIANQNGNVTATNTGNLSVATLFGLVKVEKVHGNLSVDNANGGVTANDIAGNAHVHTSFASVFIKDVDGAVDVENQNGAIAVSGLRGGCNNVSLKTTFSPIKVAVGANASYTVSARTTFGSIDSDLPMRTSGKGSSDSSTSLNGTIGDGACRMELVTSMGGITISRE